MPRPSEPRASICRIGLRTTLAVAMIVGPWTPRPAHAAPTIPVEVQEHYDRGARERDAGNFVVAASEFAAAYAGMPASQKELRVSVLFDLVDAQRQAYGAGGRVRGREHPAAHLCAANETLTEFIDAAEKARKGKGKRSGDMIRATELRSEVRSQIDVARKDAPDLNCATVEYPSDAAIEPEREPEKAPPRPRTPRKIDKPLVITGAVLSGFGLIMVGLMAGGLVRGKRAEAEGEALVTQSPTIPADDADLLDIDHRGKVGNRMAIAGGVLGTLALGTGIALLVVGLRGRPSKVAVAPAMSPRGGGLMLRWQF